MSEARPTPIRDALGEIQSHPRDVASELRAALAEKRLISHASAISYQLLFALVPLSLAALAFLSLLGLSEVWNDELRDQARGHLSHSVFELVDGTAQQIMTSKRTLWLTVGSALALWKLSAAARVTMDALDEIYRVRERIRGLRRYVRSIALALAASACLFAAVVVVIAGGRDSRGVLPGALSFVIRWGIAFLLMLLAAGLILRYAPSRRPPLRWVSIGSLLVVSAWAITSLAFGVYAARFAQWGTLFGGLATAIVLMLYLYLSAIAFLLGAQLDMLLRTEARRAKS